MRRNGVTLESGFRLEEPDVSVRWGASVMEFLGAFTEKGFDQPRRISAGHYVSECRALGGLKMQIGFHFEPESDAGVLGSLDLFDNGEREIERSYQVFHEKLVQQFGEPTREEPGPLGGSMPNCEWRIGSVSVMHYAMDRFGPEEHLRIRKEAATLWSNGRVVSAVLVGLGLVILYTWCTEMR